MMFSHRESKCDAKFTLGFSFHFGGHLSTLEAIFQVSSAMKSESAAFATARDDYHRKACARIPWHFICGSYFTNGPKHKESFDRFGYS